MASVYQDRGLMNDFFNTYNGVMGMFTNLAAANKASDEYSLYHAQLPLQYNQIPIQQAQLNQQVRATSAQDAIYNELLSGNLSPEQAAQAYYTFGVTPSQRAANFASAEQHQDNLRLSLLNADKTAKNNLLMMKMLYGRGGLGGSYGTSGGSRGTKDSGGVKFDSNWITQLGDESDIGKLIPGWVRFNLPQRASILEALYAGGASPAAAISLAQQILATLDEQEAKLKTVSEGQERNSRLNAKAAAERNAATVKARMATTPVVDPGSSEDLLLNSNWGLLPR